MRKIDKGPSPASLVNFKVRNPNAVYRDLSTNLNGHQTRLDIRTSCVEEQYYLCAYCCNRIRLDDCHNEHIIAQDVDPRLSLTYTNIVASCNGSDHCGASKKTSVLPITPLMADCQTEIKYYLSGDVDSNTTAGKSTISILGLNSKKLSEVRRQLVSGLIFVNGEDPDKISTLENDLLDLMIQDILSPSANKLEAFAPILASILEDFKIV